MNNSCVCAANDAPGLYVHVPFCDGKCGYCAFYSVLYDKKTADRFLNALKKDLARFPALNPETIYIGGGTPSILSAGQLERLCGHIRERANTRRLREWTVEINPGSVTSEKLAVLRAAGATRLSLGVQSLDDAVLKFLGRRHTSADVYKAAAMIQDSGGWRLGIDLIACVPGFPMSSWRRTLAGVCCFGPEHVSVYALTIEEGAALALAAAAGKIGPQPEGRQLRELRLAEQILSESGYNRYEISNYARPGGECLHNIACWRGKRYTGFGPAACSHIGMARRTNSPDVGAYISALELGLEAPGETERLSRQTKLAELLVFGLRMSEGVAGNLAARAGPTLLEMEGNGLIERAGGRARLTAHGMELADYVAGELLAAMR